MTHDLSDASWQMRQLATKAQNLEGSQSEL
jgi:hypothetical protein